MAARRDADRDSSKYTSGSGSSKSKLNEFFVDGRGIHREVMQKEICKYLGPEAHSRPSKYNGIQGYIVTAIRPFTAEQLDQLIELSEAYASENREKRSRGRQDVPYDQSDTLRHQEATSGLADAPYVQDRYQPQDPYTPYTPDSAAPGYQPGPYRGYLGSTYAPDLRSDPRYYFDPRQDYPQSSMYPNSRDYPPFIPKERKGDPYRDDERDRRGETIEEKRRREREREREEVERRDPRAGDPRATGDPHLPWMGPPEGRARYDYTETSSYDPRSPRDPMDPRFYPRGQDMARGASTQSGYSAGSSAMGGYASSTTSYSSTDMRSPYDLSGSSQSVYPPRGPPSSGADVYRNEPIREDPRYGRR